LRGLQDLAVLSATLATEFKLRFTPYGALFCGWVSGL